MVQILARGLLLCVFILLVGCAPRGETKSLDEILTRSQSRFDKALRSQDLQGDLSRQLADIQQLLNNVASQSDHASQDSLREIMLDLDPLVDHAGFTSRPAFGEILKQYRKMSGEHAEMPSIATVRLLISRTYTLLAQELETTAFRVAMP